MGPILMKWQVCSFTGESRLTSQISEPDTTVHDGSDPPRLPLTRAMKQYVLAIEYRLTDQAIRRDHPDLRTARRDGAQHHAAGDTMSCHV
jgi:hypothetical protein